MSTIYGTVIDKQVNVDIRKQDGGSYKGYRIAYRNEAGEIRELAKTMQSLKYTPSVAAALDTLGAGDEFTLVQEKNAKGFLDVKSLSKGKVEVDLPDQQGSNGGATTVSQKSVVETRGKVIGSTYETPEERKLKQRLIVRQAAINQALNFNPVDIDVILGNAEKFENWVYRGLE